MLLCVLGGGGGGDYWCSGACGVVFFLFQCLVYILQALPAAKVSHRGMFKQHSTSSAACGGVVRHSNSFLCVCVSVVLPVGMVRVRGCGRVSSSTPRGRRVCVNNA